MPKVRIQRKWDWRYGIGEWLVPGQNKPRFDLDDLGHLNDEAPTPDDFMAVTSITPPDSIISTTTAFDVGSILLEAGVYRLYAYAGPIQSSATLTIRAKTTAGSILATITNAASLTLMGPSSTFSVDTVQYIVFDAAMSATGSSAIIRSISISRV